MVKLLFDKNIYNICMFAFFGAILRILTFIIFSEFLNLESIFSTFIINMVGTLGYGYFVYYHRISENIRKDLLSGFFGSFTTFAIFELDLYFLFDQQKLLLGMIFILLYCFIGIIFFQIGTYYGKKTSLKSHEKMDSGIKFGDGK